MNRRILLLIGLLAFVAFASFMVGWTIKSSMLQAWESHLELRETEVLQYQCIKNAATQQFVPQLLNISIPTP